jgi:hypothetical protein
MKKISYDIIGNQVNQDKTLAEQAADLGALIFERDSAKSIFGNDPKRMAVLKMMIDIQEKVALNRLNVDEEKANLPTKEKPYLRIVK